MGQQLGEAGRTNRLQCKPEPHLRREGRKKGDWELLRFLCTFKESSARVSRSLRVKIFLPLCGWEPPMRGVASVQIQQLISEQLGLSVNYP